MSSKDWQVGPVLKDKLGSQGTLFRGGTKWMSDERFPKGYGPERQKEVADAVVRPSVKVFMDKRGRQENTGTASSHFHDRRVTVGMNPDYPKGYRMESAQPVRSLVDNIARSTVPVGHLSGVQWRTNHTAQTLRSDSVAGHYDQRGDAMSEGKPVIRLRGGHEGGSVPIHEIGHHVSLTQGTGHSRYSSPEQRGREEGFADDYALEHYRGPKGERESPHHVYAGGLRSEDRTEAFYAGYHAHRGTQDIDWGKPTQFQVRAAKQAAEDDASALFHTVPERHSYTKRPVVNPAALPEGKTPEDVNPTPKTSNWHDKYRW